MITVERAAAPAGAIATAERPATVRAEAATRPTARVMRFAFMCFSLLFRICCLLPRALEPVTRSAWQQSLGYNKTRPKLWANNRKSLRITLLYISVTNHRFGPTGSLNACQQLPRHLSMTAIAGFASGHWPGGSATSRLFQGPCPQVRPKLGRPD